MIYLPWVIIKLTARELAELMTYSDGPFGERGFAQFMTGICFRTDEETGEIDIDRDDIAAISKYSRRGHKKVLARIFSRPIDDAERRFLGNS